MTTSHPTSLHPTSDREALSALFDGELGGDTARFALKRLDHDADWRGTCERWSLVGDVLRGQGHALLPAGFPARMRATTVAQAVPVAATPRWARLGGAGLAASVAAVAVFFAYQNAEVASPAAAPSLVATVPPPAQPTVPPASPRPEAPGTAQLASAGVAIAQASRQSSQRARRSPRAATSMQAPVRKPAPSVPTAVAETAIAVAPVMQHASEAPRPFSGTAAVARPWPRAVLPQIGGTGALAAGFGTTSPSFYPFEPRLPASGDGDVGEMSARPRGPAP